MPPKTKTVDSYLIPELEIRISRAWLRHIKWVQENVPQGQVCYKTDQGEPTELVPEHTKRRIRFDKEGGIPESSAV